MRRVRFALACATALAVAQAADAQGPGRARRGIGEACAADAARLCLGTRGVEPGPGQGLVRCLREHESELSEACRTQLPPRDPR